MPVVTMKQLLEAGVHFGHQTRRWNPKMKPFIFQERNGIYILDLQQTLKRIEESYHFLKDVTAKGGKVLFVGTKKQACDAIEEEAGRAGMLYINQRWLGGLMTNFKTIHVRIKKLRELEAMEENGDLENMPKKEAKVYRTQLNKLRKYLGGVRDMDELPQALFIVDLKKEYIAFLEARKLNIPVVALVDTNCDPTGVDYPIPGNDDAIRAVRLLSKAMATACEQGVKSREMQESDFQAEEGAEAAAEAKDEAAPAEAQAAPVAEAEPEPKPEPAPEVDLKEKEVFEAPAQETEPEAPTGEAAPENPVQ